MSAGPHDRVSKLVEPSLRDMGYRLVRVRFTGGGRPVLQIMAERLSDGGMDIDDCEEVSRAVSALLDVEDSIQGPYQLEVSSPGIDRPLVHPADFERFAGYDVKIEMQRPVDGRKRFKGRLRGISEGKVLLDLADAEVVLDVEAIAEAKLVLTDELIEASLRESKAREKARERADRTE